MSQVPLPPLSPKLLEIALQACCWSGGARANRLRSVILHPKSTVSWRNIASLTMSALSSTFWTHYPERRSAQAHPCAVHRFLRFRNVPRIDYQSKYYSGTTNWYRGLVGYRKTSMSCVIPASSSLSSLRRPDSTIRRLRSGRSCGGEATGLNSIGSLSPKASGLFKRAAGKKCFVTPRSLADTRPAAASAEEPGATRISDS